MASSKTYEKVSEGIWGCVKTTSQKEHDTKYDCDSTGNHCTASTTTKVGTIVLTCDEDPLKKTLAYTIKKKPGIVSESQIWDGCESTLRSCGWSG